MKILRLKTAVVEGNFDWTFVRIETDEGIRGLGECFFAPGFTSMLRSFEPVIQGEDPRDIHRLFRKLRREHVSFRGIPADARRTCDWHCDTRSAEKVGGLATARRIAELADDQTIPIAPHNISSPVGTLASAHFCAAIPNFLVMEFHASEVPFWNDLVEGVAKPVIQDGHITVPDKPGLGVTLNEEVARRYARKGEPFFE